MTTSPAGDKLPNVNGLRDAKPRHSLGYRVQHRARTIVASVIAAMLVFSGTAAAATWLDVNGIIKDHSVEIIGYRELPLHEAEAAWRVIGQSHDLDQRLAGTGDDEAFAGGGGLDQSGKVGLGLVHIHGFHRDLLSPAKLVGLGGVGQDAGGGYGVDPCGIYRRCWGRGMKIAKRPVGFAPARSVVL